MNKKEHLDYIFKKQNKTCEAWDEIMLRHGLFTDFEKPSTIKTNSKSSHNAKTSPNKPASNQNILNKKKFNESKKDKRFPKVRIDQ